MSLHNKFCKVSFPKDEDMDRAFDVLIYESDNGFSSAGENSLIISQEQCKKLEELQEKGELSYSHLN